jgi:hypothetical protein
MVRLLHRKACLVHRVIYPNCNDCTFSFCGVLNACLNIHCVGGVYFCALTVIIHANKIQQVFACLIELRYFARLNTRFVFLLGKL